METGPIGIIPSHSPARWCEGDLGIHLGEMKIFVTQVRLSFVPIFRVIVILWLALPSSRMAYWTPWTAYWATCLPHDFTFRPASNLKIHAKTCLLAWGSVKESSTKIARWSASEACSVPSASELLFSPHPPPLQAFLSFLHSPLL